MNTWIIISPIALHAALKSYYAKRHLPESEWLTDLISVLHRNGSLIAKETPYVILRMMPKDDELPLALATSESLDWAMVETVSLSIKAASLDEVPKQVVLEACLVCLPQILETLKQDARILMLNAADEVIAEARLNPTLPAAQLLAHCHGGLGDQGMPPLPYDQYRIVAQLLATATTVARKRGLNAYQLFAEGRIDRLVPGHADLAAFRNQSPARQEAARRWVISALGWNRYFDLPTSPASGETHGPGAKAPRKEDDL